MSERAIRRLHERDGERRARARRRRNVSVGLAAGAAALALPASAQATNYTVFSLADPAPGSCDGSCTLREAINAANGSAGADTIVFNSGLSGSITLAQGQLAVTDPAGLTITAPEGGVDISGDELTRVMGVTGGLELNGDFGIRDGYESGSSDPGGGILADGPNADLVLRGTQFSGNTAKYGGGAVAAVNDASVTMTGASVVANRALAGGGVMAKYGAEVNATDTTFTANGGTQETFVGAAVMTGKYGGFTGESLTIRNNSGGFIGGGVAVAPAGDAAISDSTISGNSAFIGGGGLAYFGASGGGITDPGSLRVSDSTISSNSSQLGGGLVVNNMYAGAAVIVSGSTLSGNTVFEFDESGTDYYGTGGGVAITGAIAGSISFNNSTVAGNDADYGGGVGVGSPYQPTVLRAAPALRRQGVEGDAAELTPAERQARFLPGGSLNMDSLTIADNSATAAGGGFFNGTNGSGMSYYNETIPLRNTIVAGNQVGTVANDLAETNVAGGSFQLANSLVQAKGNATVGQNPAGSSILGVDPQLGSLRNNGGPTKTMLPAPTSPVVDAGNTGLTTDQRGAPRPQGPADDIGSVEIPDTIVRGARLTAPPKQKMKGKKLIVKLSAGAGEAVQMTASGKVGKAQLQAQTKPGTAGQTIAFQLKASKKAGKKVLKKLGKGKKLAAALSVRFTDNAGNVQTLSTESELSAKKKKKKKK